MEPITTTAIAAGAGAWIGDKLLGPTANIVGEDLKHLYEKGRDRIVVNAIKKTKDVEDKAQTNLRVTRDVFWNGSFTDDAICAEYFGGILAASRSANGKDDSGVFFVDIIKSMSSNQLKMHYIIYRTLNKELIANKQKSNLNPSQETELVNEELYIPLLEINDQFGNEDIGVILHGIHAKNLIGDFQTSNHILDSKGALPFLKVIPKSLGIQLFAIANNEFADWRNFSHKDFGDFDEVTLPQYYAQSLDVLLERAGLKKTDNEVEGVGKAVNKQ